MHFMKEVKVQLMDVIIIGPKEGNGYKNYLCKWVIIKYSDDQKFYTYVNIVGPKEGMLFGMF
jgi:hypothetical protein